MTEPGDPSKVNWSSRARTWALTQLTHEHWEEYRRLLEEEYQCNPNGKPQSRAKTRLSHRYHDRMRAFYLEEKARLLAIPVEVRVARRPQFLHVRKADHSLQQKVS